MEVTRSNFQQLLPTINEVIAAADFVAIDCEFTGISTENINLYDSLAEYYQKKWRGCFDYQILQIGLATFKYHEDTDKYTTSCFNFYVFPYPVVGVERKSVFQFQPSCMAFLASMNFDFNKVFREGISFMSRSDEQQYRKTLDEKRERRVKAIGTSYDYRILNVPPEHQAEIDSVCEQVADFVEKNDFNATLEIGPFNSFIRRLIINNVGGKFNGKVVFNLKTEPESNLRTMIVALRGDEEQQRKREDQIHLEEEKLLEEAIGVGYVFRRISESGKLVIGHSMLLDLMYMINHFMEKLPYHYQSFKDLANLCFSNLIDTKYMATCSPFKEKMKSSMLSDMIDLFMADPKTFSAPKIEVDEGNLGYTLQSNKWHDAGFDAFQTGVCFLTMLKHLQDDSERKKPFNPKSRVLSPYLNKLFVFRLTDIPYIKLDGKDPEPNRDNVLYVEFSKTVNSKYLENVFSDYGKIKIGWINSESAFIGLNNATSARNALKLRKKIRNIKIMSYVEYDATKNAARPFPSKVQLENAKLKDLTRNDPLARFNTSSGSADSDLGKNKRKWAAGQKRSHSDGEEDEEDVAGSTPDNGNGDGSIGGAPTTTTTTSDQDNDGFILVQRKKMKKKHEGFQPFADAKWD